MNNETQYYKYYFRNKLLIFVLMYIVLFDILSTYLFTSIGLKEGNPLAKHLIEIDFIYFIIVRILTMIFFGTISTYLNNLGYHDPTKNLIKEYRVLLFLVLSGALIDINNFIAYFAHR